MCTQRHEDYLRQLPPQVDWWLPVRDPVVSDPALEDYNENYEPWKDSLSTLTDGVSLAANSVEKMQLGFYAMCGLSLWSLKKNHPLLMLANASTTIALGIFCNTLSHYAAGFHEHSQTIVALDVDNREGFAESITQNYEELGSQIWTIERYLTRRKSLEEVAGLRLLREDIDAIEGVQQCQTLMKQFKVDKVPVEIESEENFDIAQIQAVFERVEGIAGRVQKVSFRATLLGVGYLSLAYWDRARVMMVAGAVFTGASGVLCSTAHRYKVGAQAIQEAEENQLVEFYNKTIARRFLPKVADTTTLQQGIVLPLENILKVIPLR